MRIRLHGTQAEVTATAEHLIRVLDVLNVSRPYPDRPPSRLVRVYLTATPPITDATSSETPEA